MSNPKQSGASHQGHKDKEASVAPQQLRQKGHKLGSPGESKFHARIEASPVREGKSSKTGS